LNKFTAKALSLLKKNSARLGDTQQIEFIQAHITA